MPPITIDQIPTLAALYTSRDLLPADPGTIVPQTLALSVSPLPIRPSTTLNSRLHLINTDITTLALNAITNAANKSLLGGGGIDGAIHRAAGPQLLHECRTLGGCETGRAKITDAYELPCKKVIHTVGPVYNERYGVENEELLTSCYEEILELAVRNGCKTLALCGISTGVFGYPHKKAVPIALSTVRRFLLGANGKKVEGIVFVTFEEKDVQAYNTFIPLYFPPPTEGAESEHVEYQESVTSSDSGTPTAPASVN